MNVAYVQQDKIRNNSDTEDSDSRLRYFRKYT